jgi:isocitrate dehydrogenase
VIIRENEEDLYAGIEHQQTDEVVQCLKLISRPGCEKIVRYAFEYARQNNRKKVSCFSKDNIMKATDGLFHKVFNEVAVEYPDIKTDHWIIDIGSAMLADQPERFDVIVTLNLYGDIISDIAAQIAGSVGLAGSSNIGESCAMFEAIHGSAPDIAGKGIANPTGLINGAILMLNHIGQSEVGEKIQNALLKTIEDGVHTFDIYEDGSSARRVSTNDFAESVIANLGKKPEILRGVENSKGGALKLPSYKRAEAKTKKLLGADIFVHWRGDVNELAEKLIKLKCNTVELSMITNRGIKVWPDGFEETFCTDHWRCRYFSNNDSEMTKIDIIKLLIEAESNGIDVIKTENLYEFDGVKSFSLGQGQ